MNQMNYHTLTYHTLVYHDDLAYLLLVWIVIYRWQWWWGEKLFSAYVRTKHLAQPHRSFSLICSMFLFGSFYRAPQSGYSGNSSFMSDFSLLWLLKKLLVYKMWFCLSRNHYQTTEVPLFIIKDYMHMPISTNMMKKCFNLYLRVGFLICK